MAHQRSRLYKPPYPFVRNDASSQAIGLISWWPGFFSGKLWNFSSVPFHCTLNSFASPFTNLSGWGPGKDGGQGALVFDGTDDGASLTTTQTAQLFYFGAAQAFSVDLWLKPASGNVATAFLVGVRNAPVGPDGSGWFLYYDGTNSGLYWDFYGGAGTGVQLHQRQSSAGSVPVGIWTKITCTRDTTNTIGGTKIFINGLPNTGTPTDIGPTPTNPIYTGAFGIGKNPQATANPYKGSIEDVKIYNGALTQAQSWNSYQKPWDLRYQLGRIVHYGPGNQVAVSGIDAPITSESATRTLAALRTTTDNPTLSDVALVGNFFDKTTSDSPTLFETITTNYVFGRSATDSPTFSEVITTQKILFRSISQSLIITHSNLVATPIQSVDQGLTISQSVSVTADISKSVESELFFSQSADYEQFIPTEISQSLTITQIVDVVQTTGVGNILTITQDVVSQYAPHYDFYYALLLPTQTVGIAAIFNRTLEQFFTLSQVVSTLKIKPVSASNTLIIGQLLEGGVVRKAFNILVLSQNVVKETFRNKTVNQSLAITQSVGLQMILNRSLVSTLILKDEHPIPNGAGGTIQVPNLIYTRGGSTLDNCSCTVPSATTVFQSSTRAIVLPNPEYNDSEGLVAAVSIQKTITGQTYSYVKKSANRKLKYKFIISQRKAYELRRFLLDFLGERLTLNTFKGEIWSGYLLTDPAEITSSSRGGICTGDLYQVDLEFQGVRLN